MRITPSALPHLLLLAAPASLSISHRASAAASAPSPRRRTGGLRRSQQRRALNPGKRPNHDQHEEEEREREERKEKFDKLLAEMEEIESEIQELEDEFSEDDPDEISSSSSWEDKEIGGAEEEDEADGEMTTGIKTTLDRDDEDEENQAAVGELKYQPPDYGGGDEEEEGSELDELEDEAQNAAAAQLLDVEGYDLPSRPSSEGQNPDEDEDAALETEEAEDGGETTVADGPGGAPPNKKKPAGPRSVPHDLPAVEHFHVSAHQVLDGDVRTEKETAHYKWSLGKPKSP